jgi:hypothetical protein
MPNFWTQNNVSADTRDGVLFPVVVDYNRLQLGLYLITVLYVVGLSQKGVSGPIYSLGSKIGRSVLRNADLGRYPPHQRRRVTVRYWCTRT